MSLHASRRIVCISKPIIEARLHEVLGGALGRAAGPDAAATERRPSRYVPGRRESDGRILLAEDHPVNQQVLLAMLGQLGLAADPVFNGAQAIRGTADDRLRSGPDGLRDARGGRIRGDAPDSEPGDGNLESASPDRGGDGQRDAGRSREMFAMRNGRLPGKADRAGRIGAGAGEVAWASGAGREMQRWEDGGAGGWRPGVRPVRTVEAVGGQPWAGRKAGAGISGRYAIAIAHSEKVAGGRRRRQRAQAGPQGEGSGGKPVGRALCARPRSIRSRPQWPVNWAKSRTC